jgi:nitrate reductase NapE component
VYYHPDDPEDAVLEPGANIVPFLFLALGLLVIGIGVIGLLGFLG